MHARAGLVAIVLLAACGGGSPRTTATPLAPGLDRLRFNQLALRLDLPLFWGADANGNGVPDPDEVHSLRFYPLEVAWTEPGRFTADFDVALRRIRAEHEAPVPTDPRLAAVVSELDHAAPTLISTDLRTLPPAHQAFARHMLVVGELIDRLYARQNGAEALRPRVADDSSSRALFRRNWGAACRSSAEESNPACSAIPGAPEQPVDVYPAQLQESDDFCEVLQARPDAASLTTPFTVVRLASTADGAFDPPGSVPVRMVAIEAPPPSPMLVAIPYSVAYADLMQPIAAELRAAADAMTDPAETALVTYLRAAATAFETNDWPPADEAWAAMNARNSAWYVRVGPDETYWEPCSLKAGFHLTFARIDRGSLEWQDRLTPLQRDMEAAVAALVPGEYTARDVSFHMPDFIEIVLNAGDDRDGFGATIGQSLPNWGPVADEGRGRTVAMSNLYTDEDSLARRRAQAASLFDAATMAEYVDDPGAGLLSTILHEAGHNLGPSHDYRAPSGLTADEAFGGPLSSMMEELKAQSSALFFVELLRSRGVISDADARHTYVDSIAWALGHVSRGMWTPTGTRKAYSQLAAIQIGFLMDQGAIRWDADAMAADGEHRGAFTIDLAAMPAACDALMTTVVHLKAVGDRAGAEALANRYVGESPEAGTAASVVPHATIVERWAGAFPQVAFVYEILE